MTARPGWQVLAFAALFAVLSGTAAEAEVIKVTVEKLAFSPPTVTAKVGDTIEWTNKDFVAHSATEDNGDWNLLLPVGGTASLQVEKAGTFGYYCIYHPNMRGEIRAEAP